MLKNIKIEGVCFFYQDRTDLLAGLNKHLSYPAEI